MKKIWAYGLILTGIFCASNVSATHREIGDASNLITGTVPNARLDVGSVTLQGNLFNGTSQLIQANADGFVQNADIDPSSVTKLGNSFNGASQLIQAGSDGLVSNADIDPSSITKQGNNFNGASQLIQAGSDGFVSNADLDPSSVTKLGAGPFISSGSATVNSFHLNTTGVGSGQYGSETVSPVLTFSSDGRLLGVSSAAIANAGGGGVAFSTTTPRTYSIIVATGYGLGADIVGTTDQAWRAAITSANLMGVSSIFIRSGTYNFAAGVTTYINLGSELYITCEASTTITTTGMNQALIIGSFTVVDGGFFRTPASYSGAGFIEMLSSSTLKNAKFDANLTDDGSAKGNPALLTSGRNIYIENVTCLRLITNSNITKFANILSSNDVYVKGFRGYAHTMDANGNSAWFNIEKSSDLSFLDMDNTTTNGYDFLIRGGSSRMIVSRGRFKHTGTTNETSVYILPSGSIDISSGIVFADNDYMWNGAGTVFDFDASGGQSIYGFSIEGNRYHGNGAGTFIDVDAVTINTRISDNKTFRIGTFISDSGTGTVLNDNFLNGNAVADN